MHQRTTVTAPAQEKVTGRSAGYGFVKYKDRAAAEAALTTLHGKALLGQVGD